MLAETLRLIPGYDPFATAGDCWLDEAAAQRVIDFFGHPVDGCLRHIEGAMAGKLFVLEPWQQAIVGNLFGWMRKGEDGQPVRRYREAFIFVARKNGKTPLVAGLANYVLFCDPEIGQQNYIAAAEREQAAMLFRHSRGMVEREPALASRCRIYGGNAAAGQSKSIVREDTGSFMRVISADADSQHGGNSHFIAIDELHAQPGRNLVDVLTTSLASKNRRQPLICYLTTSDYDRESICNEKYDYACKVRDGVTDDPSFLPAIYEVPFDADWTAPASWRLANPNLGISVSQEYLARECKRAQETPAYENTFRRLHLNQRTQQDVRWMAIETWDRSSGLEEDVTPRQWREAMLAQLRGESCWAGLDLSSTQDLTSLSLVFQREGSLVVLPFFWVPQDCATQKERKDRVPYSAWMRQGFVEPCSQATIDYDVIRARIHELAEQYRIEKLAIDRWNATQIYTQLTGDGFDVELFGQGFASMSAPTKELERRAVEGTLLHGGNPVLRWNVDNAMSEQDAAGNVKLSKKKSSGRIDGLIASIMGIALCMTTGSGKSIYETKGSLSL